MKKRISKKIILGLYIVCAVIWTLVLALDFVYGQANRWIFIMHGVCALAWDIAAVGWFLNVRRGGEKDKNSQNGDDKNHENHANDTRF